MPEDWKLLCVESDAEKTFMTNQMQDSLDCYTFTLVCQGWVTIVYNGKEMTLNRNDLYTYTPGFLVTIVSASEDYHSVCLMAEEDLTLETPVVRNIIRAAYFPFVEMQEPKLTLSEDNAEKLCRRMKDIIECQQSDHLFRDDLLRLLYAAFLLDLLNIQEHSIARHHISERSEELFLGFIRLLPLHFAEHHDIPFYANQLSITPIYLSRIVKQITGRTVVEYINQMLLMEASWLLLTTRLTINQIADRLHFSSHASFIRFFTRMKSITPKQYRMRK